MEAAACGFVVDDYEGQPGWYRRFAAHSARPAGETCGGDDDRRGRERLLRSVPRNFGPQSLRTPTGQTGRLPHLN